ncbi:hypothetical protein [Ectobacillus panaciterrae]|uniref:hypothetical protein n=1 Tax=Ectobacillus panaciterrae TaxID=363872 RepID=UPI000428BBD1|nr:hypothetical protein [Ectobacillus panaciterrae]
MTVAMGVICAILCLILAEGIHIWLAKFLCKKGAPYEMQHLPLFFIMFLTLCIIRQYTLFPPAFTALFKFGLLYSGAGAVILLFLALIRQMHYQSYILIINWLKRE